MRVALLHNTSAGSEDHTDAELIDNIRRAGHEVAHVVARVKDLTAALHRGACDIVVVAGGDGTVGRAACELSGWQIPLSILPLGTANNTARALDLARSPKKLIKSWHKASAVPFDLAFLDDGAVRARFAEAVGWGVFPATVERAKRRPSSGSRRHELKQDRKLFRSCVSKAPARFYAIDIDGRDCSGEYVLVEAVNVPFIGPQLKLSPRSDPGDGVLELILAGAHDRAALDELARTGELDPSALRCERGSNIRVLAGDGILHRDGSLIRHALGSRAFEISVDPGAIAYWR
jgi:diacylglycerol kinase family enzyme